MAVRRQLGHLSKVKLGGTIEPAPHRACALHVIAGGFKLTGAEYAQPLFENLDPALLAGFRVATAKQLVNNDALFFSSDAKFPKLPRDKAVTELLSHSIGDEHLGAEVFVQ